MRIISPIKIPMLLYHALFEGSANVEKYAITMSEFERHIRYLSENGFRSISLADFLIKHQPDDNKKNIIITFDDGNYSDYSRAFPIVRKYGFVATFFVTVNRIGTDGYLDWHHLKEMIDHGMSIQSHSLNHSFLSDLSNELLQKELNESKKILEEKLAISINFISLPGGFNSQRVLNAARDAGYKGVVSSCPGLNRRDRENGSPLFFRRFVITRKTTTEEFIKIVHGDLLHIIKNRMLYFLKSFAKKVLGSQGYYMIWSKFFKYRI